MVRTLKIASLLSLAFFVIGAGPLLNTPIKKNPASASWDPTQIATLRAWGDCSDTGKVSTSGSAITAVTDKSTNAYLFAQATGANQPTVVAAAQNGLQVCNFDHSNDWLAANAGTDLNTFTACLVLRPHTLRTFDAIISASTLATNDLTYELGPTSGASFDIWDLNVGARSGSGNGTVVADTWYRTCFTYTSGSGTMYINNVSVGTTAQASGRLVTSTMTVGDDGGANFTAYGGYIGEWVIATSVLSGGDLTSLDNYWKTKWGL